MNIITPEAFQVQEQIGHTQISISHLRASESFSLLSDGSLFRTFSRAHESKMMTIGTAAYININAARTEAEEEGNTLALAVLEYIALAMA